MFHLLEEAFCSLFSCFQEEGMSNEVMEFGDSELFWIVRLKAGCKKQQRDAYRAW